MDITLQRGPIQGVAAETLVVFAFEKESPAGLDDEWVKEIYASGEFSGKACEVAILYRPAGLKAKRLALAGAGPREKFDAAAARRTAGVAARSLKCKSL